LAKGEAALMQIGGYLLARLLFQLDPATPAEPSRVACLFMRAKRSNALSSA
jgi:hypothetical protein